MLSIVGGANAVFTGIKKCLKKKTFIFLLHYYRSDRDFEVLYITISIIRLVSKMILYSGDFQSNPEKQTAINIL